MILEMDKWQIIHIPNKPAIPPNQQPTVNVFASMVEPKLANTIIRRLNQVAPLENLRHVKRIQKKFLEGGKTQLSMILCLADENDNRMNSLPQDVQELVNSYQCVKMLLCQKKNGKNNASCGQHHTIHQLTILMALLALMKMTPNQFSAS